MERFKNGSGKVFIPIRNTWTHKWVMGIDHGLAGLGEKESFQKDGNAEHVQKKLIESYPVLKECGGYEIMRSVVGSCKLLEVLLVPPGGYNVPYLKSCLLQAKGYIRRIQKQLSLEPLSEKDDSFAVSMTPILIVHVYQNVNS